jgi:hypothetical protein
METVIASARTTLITFFFIFLLLSPGVLLPNLFSL